MGIVKTLRRLARPKRKRQRGERYERVLLERGKRYRWTLRFDEVPDEATADELIQGLRADEFATAGRLVSRRPLVYSYVLRQPLTNTIALGKPQPLQGMPGVRETVIGIAPVD